jgi:hypothetical protein
MSERLLEAMLPIYHLLTDPGFYFMIVVVVVATLVLKTRDEIGLRWRTLASIHLFHHTHDVYPRQRI